MSLSCSFSNRNLRGFTLVELLVVISIIGILVAVLLPAIQSARGAARRMQCKNHLKQLGLAALNHEANYGFFPSSGWGFRWVGDPDRGSGKSQPGGWAYQLLPFIEQQAIYDIGRGLTGYDVGGDKYNALAEQKSAPVAAFHCPSRRPAIAYPGGQTSYNSAQPAKVAKTDYAVNGGTGPMLGVNGPGITCLNTYPNCTWPFPQSYIQQVFTGVSTLRSEIRNADISDGTSNTLLFGEKYLNPARYETSSCVGDNTVYQGNDWDVTRWVPAVDSSGNLTNYDARRPFPDTPGLYDCTERFGSAHPALFHVVLCDGSVHGIEYEIDGHVWSYLGNRRDGELITGVW